MHLRHGHGDTAAYAGNDQQILQCLRRQAQRTSAYCRLLRGCGCVAVFSRRPPAQRKHQGDHGGRAEDRDAEEGMPPSARLDEMLNHRRPQRPGQVIAAGNDGHGDAAPAGEPVRHIRKQRRERRRTAEADEQAVGDRVLPERGSRGGGGVSEREAEDADDDRRQDPETIRHPAQDDAADAETKHRQRIGKGRIRARNPELGLHRRQRHHHRPHADPADGRKDQRQHQPCPRVSGIHPAKRHAIIVLLFVPHRAGLCLKCRDGVTIVTVVTP